MPQSRYQHGWRRPQPAMQGTCHPTETTGPGPGLWLPAGTALHDLGSIPLRGSSQPTAARWWLDAPRTCLPHAAVSKGQTREGGPRRRHEPAVLHPEGGAPGAGPLATGNHACGPQRLTFNTVPKPLHRAALSLEPCTRPNGENPPLREFIAPVVAVHSSTPCAPAQPQAAGRRWT